MREDWHVMRSDDGGESWQKVSGKPPSDFGFPIAVHAHEPETVYVVPIESDSEHVAADRQAPRLSQPDGRKRMGGAHRRLPRALLRERAPRRDVGGTASIPAASTSGQPGARSTRRRTAATGGRRIVRDLPPVLSSRRRRCRDSRRASAAPSDACGRRWGGFPRRPGAPTQRTVLDALEASYPTLRGTIRDHGTAKAQGFHPLLRLWDRLTLDSADDPLPDEVAREPSRSGWWVRWRGLAASETAADSSCMSSDCVLY